MSGWLLLQDHSKGGIVAKLDGVDFKKRDLMVSFISNLFWHTSFMNA